MFNPKPTSEASSLDEVIKALDARIVATQPDNDDYAKLVAQRVILHKMRDPKVPTRVSPDVLATVAANLAGIFMILTYEHGRVVTSKALSFVLKVRG